MSIKQRRGKRNEIVRWGHHTPGTRTKWGPRCPKCFALGEWNTSVLQTSPTADEGRMTRSITWF